MAKHESNHFLAGVIEGFYGQPWTPEERQELFQWMAAWGLNTYLYAPKGDLHQRATWRELYSAGAIAGFRDLLTDCRQRQVRFFYALSPGLDIRYHESADWEHIQRRFSQMRELGCQGFALLFDDIPDRMEAEALARFGSLAGAQSAVANAVFRWLREQDPAASLLFCPTPYCGRMVAHQHGGEGYLAILGRELATEIDILWTGPEIISREITVAHIRELAELLRRKPVIWDNLHANDYDGHRCFCGPYAGRPPELRAEVRGLLSNPNSEFPLNFIPLRTLGSFVHAGEAWDPRAAYNEALQEWWPRFATGGASIPLADLRFFADGYYLPHGEGAEAQEFLQTAREVLTRGAAAPPDQVAGFLAQATRLRAFCNRVTELHDRRLFYALNRRIWELGEELDLLGRFVEATCGKVPPNKPFRSDFHLPGLYRGGLVARLQKMLIAEPDGTFTPARQPESSPGEAGPVPAAN